MQAQSTSDQTVNQSTATGHLKHARSYGASRLSHGGLTRRDLPGKTHHTSILVDATREFSLIARPDKAEVNRYKELFYQFIDRLEKTDRRLISAMLARSAFAPRAVALYLAQDALEVAAPFLLFSPILNDLDLRAIAAKRGKIYADVIKKRQLPMEPFTSRKLDEAIAVPRSEPSATLNKPRPGENAPDKNSETSDEIIALAGVGGRLGKRPARNETSVPAQEEKATGTFKSFKLPKREIRSLLKAVRKQDHHGFAAIVEEICGLETEATVKLLGTSSGNEALYLIKALGVPSPHDMQMALMALPRIGRSVEGYREAKKTLGELDPGICQMIFNEIGARFDLGGRPVMKFAEPAPARAPYREPDFQEALKIRRQNVLETYETAHGQPAPGIRQTDLSGMTPMSRWPVPGNDLRQAV